MFERTLSLSNADTSYTAIAIPAIVKTHISSLFNGDHFHYGCALRCVALRGERYRDADSVSIFCLLSQR